MAMPIISVIIPVYNVESYIHRCVDSVLKQSFTDLEIILVDDGSPDNCSAICDEYAEKDYRVQVIHQINGGLSAARNAGLNRATGKYIYFVDSDDFIDLDLLSTVVPEMENGSDLVAFGFTRFNDSNEEKRVVWKEKEILLNKDNRVSFFAEQLLQYQMGWEAWSRVFRRDIIERNHIRFEDNAKIFAEDLYFCLCYCAHAKKIVSIDKALYYYNQRENSIMGQEKIVLNAGRMNELGKALLEHLKKESVDLSLIRAFPIIYYFIMDNVISRYTQKHSLSIDALRKLLKEDIQDYDFYITQIRRLRRNRNWMRKLYSAYETEKRIDIAEFYADGNLFLFKLKYKLNVYVEWLRVHVLRRAVCQ